MQIWIEREREREREQVRKWESVCKRGNDYTLERVPRWTWTMRKIVSEKVWDWECNEALSLSEKMLLFEWAIPGLFYSIVVFSTVDIKLCSVGLTFCRWLIQIADLWCRKQLLCQLCHRQMAFFAVICGSTSHFCHSMLKTQWLNHPCLWHEKKHIFWPYPLPLWYAVWVPSFWPFMLYHQ